MTIPFEQWYAEADQKLRDLFERSITKHMVTSSTTVWIDGDRPTQGTYFDPTDGSVNTVCPINWDHV